MSTTHLDGGKNISSECQDRKATFPESDESFARTIAFAVEESNLLSSETPQQNTSDEEHVPRIIIAEEVRGNFRLQSRLLRPLQHGTVHNSIPAFLLRPIFTFQGQSKKWRSRITFATISVLFEDAPKHPTTPRGDAPAVKSAAFYQSPYIGPTRSALVIGAAGMSVSGFSGIGGSLATSRTTLDEGNLKIETSINGRDLNQVTWVIRENSVSKAGIPTSIELPIILMPTANRRFSAKIAVHAEYGFWQGPWAEKVPVLGKNDDPLYFDPVELELREAEAARGKDGELIVERVGELDIGSLNGIALGSFV
jgi:hypothetical protein